MMRTRSSIGLGSGDTADSSDPSSRRKPPPPPPLRPGVSLPPKPRSPIRLPPAPLQIPPPPEVEVEMPATEGGWILRIRLDARTTRNIYIHHRMSVATLAECLQQCLRLNANVAGLFCETTHTFYSLLHILSLSTPEEQQCIYCFELPSPLQREIHTDQRWYDAVVEQCSFLMKTTTTNGYFLSLLLVATLLYYQYEMVYETVTFTYSTLYYTFLEEPLREIYRYGPWFIGWEGDDLPTICTRITYHGDSQFWLRNTAECTRIYTAKEQAFLRISRPFLYAFVLILFIGTARFLIREYQSYQLQLMSHHPQDRDMVDLYQAFHVILRQVWQVQPTPPSRPKGQKPIDHR